ncbi:MAG TPA: YdeI/OmpD-associated family protein [Candidatus Baltobacteraceae bacterium]|nr:YdeI/OmpD-associated family protein [Candidatus Baltobacteraceae bacterium]
MKVRKDKLPTEQFDDQTSWDRWLALHGAASPGVWLMIAKAGARRATVTKQQAIETAIRQGWIDGQLSAFDAEYYLIRFTPRRPGSKWSALNVEMAERLMRENRVTPAGLREIEAAKSDGRWSSAYAGQRLAEPPADLLQALRASPKAQRKFAELDRANRYAIIYRVQDAKQAETRAKRIATFIAMLENGQTLHPKRARRAGSVRRR